ncbi:MAG: carbohydrate kinase family protein [Anaerolineales bacterium]|nr:carbohydrate kinase family protein [Anaerolineales bacterium]MCZ2120864.1 carbohydrate kinase family protein [Anaerolineales bacterium]
MKPIFLIAGKIQREYILPPLGLPSVDKPGGSLLYAAGGLAVWNSQISLAARVGSDYPTAELKELKKRGFDIEGIRIQPHPIDLRSFSAYTDKYEISQTNAVSHFAKRQLQFPKALLGYQMLDQSQLDPKALDPLSPAALDIPKKNRNLAYIHICPLDFTSQSQLVNLFSGSNQTVSLDPAPNYMHPAFWRDLRTVLQGVKIFSPSEEELRALFWGETNDLWEMAKKISAYGPQVIVIKRGSLGQAVYDVAQAKKYEIQAYPARIEDPTGVGDAFCGGFLAGYQKTNDPLQAALYGGVSASLKIEGSGPFHPLEALPGLAEARLHALEQMAREV